MLPSSQYFYLLSWMQFSLSLAHFCSSSHYILKIIYQRLLNTYTIWTFWYLCCISMKSPCHLLHKNSSHFLISKKPYFNIIYFLKPSLVPLIHHFPLSGKKSRIISWWKICLQSWAFWNFHISHTNNFLHSPLTSVKA